MAAAAWDITDLRAYAALSPDEQHVLWSAKLPETREHDPALWDLQMGFFEDAIVDLSRRPGSLVVTPRELLKHFKRAGREPACGSAVIAALVARGDMARAGTLDAAVPPPPPTEGGVFASLRASLGRYLWPAPAAASGGAGAPGPEDALVATAALSAAAERATTALLGPIATSEVHTVRSFAAAVTGGSLRDAEAVIAQLVAQGSASALSADAPGGGPALRGVRLGRGAPAAADAGLLRTKHARERMAETAAHLEGAAADAKAGAVAAAKAGDRRAALAHVQRKAALEKKLGGARATLGKLGDVLMAVDEAESNREAVSALEVGVDSLRAATASGASAGRVDDAAANLDELLAEQHDTRVALQQLAAGNDADAALFEEELAELLREDKNEKTLADPALDVPTEVPARHAPERPPSAEETAEIELQKLLAESGIADPAPAAQKPPARGRVAAPMP